MVVLKAAAGHEQSTKLTHSDSMSITGAMNDQDRISLMAQIKKITGQITVTGRGQKASDLIAIKFDTRICIGNAQIFYPAGGITAADLQAKG